MFVLKNLDETVLSILFASAEEIIVGENLKRHKIILRDPTYFYGLYLVNFGDNYFTTETIEEAIQYIRKRFFVEKSRLF